jgi:RimJ/RimL family protein N-acetyltransferase
VAVRLVPLDETHLAGIEGLLDDPDTLRFTRVPEPVPPGFAREWLDRYEAGRRDGSREAFAVLGDDGAFVGIALAPDIDRVAGELELGYVVTPAARGRGVATELLRQLTRWAFDEVGAERIRLIIDVENAASERVAERCGYVREGVLRSTYVKASRPRANVALWSRLPSDPP